MNEFLIPEVICAYLSGMGEASFVPEAWREGEASVFLVGGEKARFCIDGGASFEVPFEVRCRSRARSVSDRLEAVRLFVKIGEYISATALPSVWDGISDIKIKSAGGVRKSAVYGNGSEEYSAPFVLGYYKTGEV